jgi:N-methylhydantoinase A
MHAVALAAELGVRKIVVPAASSVFSAWGMMMSDLRRDYFVTRLADLKPGSAAGIEAVFADTETHACQQFASEGVAGDRLTFQRYGKFRYQNQEHTTEVRLEPGAITEDRLSGIAATFHETYEREYTYRLEAPVELVGIHLVAVAAIGKLTLTQCEPTGATLETALKGRRRVDYALEGIHEAAIYDGARLEPGSRIIGPAIVEDVGSTIVLHPGNVAEVDGYGNMLIRLDL